MAEVKIKWYKKKDLQKGILAIFGLGLLTIIGTSWYEGTIVWTGAWFWVLAVGVILLAWFLDKINWK